MLPGLAPAVAVGLPLETLTVVSNTTSATDTIAYPAGVQVGDVAILFDCAEGGNYSKSALSGWTLIRGAGGSVSAIVIQYRVCDGTESGSTITCINGSTDAKRLLIVRGNVPIAGATVVDFGGSSAGASEATPVTLAMSASQKPGITLGGAVCSGGSASALSESPSAFTSSAGLNTFSRQGYKLWSASDTMAGQTISCTTSGIGRTIAAGHVSFYP